MNEDIIAAFFLFGLIPLLIFSYLIFAFISRSKERMAMIEKGILPMIKEKAQRKKNDIKGAFLFTGVGLGILVGYFVQSYWGMKGPLGYISMAFLFGGISLIIYYLMVSKGNFKNIE